jgi:hypothetical protein
MPCRRAGGLGRAELGTGGRLGLVRGGIGDGGNGEAGGGAGKVEASGTVTALLQFGHGLHWAVFPNDNGAYRVEAPHRSLEKKSFFAPPLASATAGSS